jgi:hypothetical protein
MVNNKKGDPKKIVSCKGDSDDIRTLVESALQDTRPKRKEIKSLYT